MRPNPNPNASVLLLAALAALAALAPLSNAQTVQITGKVLEKAAMGAVPGAMVTWKTASGAVLTATADTAGNYALTGNPVSLQPRQIEWNASLMRNGMLQLRTRLPNIVVTADLYDSQGRNLAHTSHRLASPGEHSVAVLFGSRRNFVGFLKVTAGEETYRLKVFHTGGPAAVTRASFVQAPGSLAKKSAAGDTLIVSMSGLLTAKVANPSNTGAQADVVMEYPARDSIGVGARRPYGAVVLFDGTQGPGAAAAEQAAKWLKWRDWPNGCQANSTGSTKNTSPANFAIAKDPEFPNDTNRVTLRSQVVTGSATRWGCDDIEARPDKYTHGDVQIHVEWIAMGQYSTTDTENPNTSTAYGTSSSGTYYVNSGVYVQNRYEIQIQSAPFTGNITDCHYMGSVVNEFAPSSTLGGGSGNTCNGTGNYASPCPGCGASNQLKHNGVWNSYDITFRTTRWNGTTKTADGYLTMWWNGVLVHYNRRVTGLATGTANTSGEAINNQLFGIKLQREANDVRFRNIWMKHLKIDSTNTAFGY